MRRAGAGAIGVVSALALLLTARPAQAVPASVTLSASAAVVAYGQSVSLSGAIDPPSGGETVDLVDASGTTVASATTAGNGSYATTYAPPADVTLHAEWGSAASPDVTVDVRAAVRVHLGAVRLFARVPVTGTIAPARPGERVTVTLLRSGRAVATHDPAMGSAGGFSTSFRVIRPGRYRVRARFSSTDLASGTATDGPRTTPLPRLRVGSKSVFVGLLERRLVTLHYHLVRIDDRYDARTGDAVLAFRKVQRMTRNRSVDAAVWRALADPVVPRPRLVTRTFHIEIDQRRQVLYTVEDRHVTAVLHVSTGKPSTPTPDGAFRVYRKIWGFSPNRLYYPSYFDANRAIHGWPDVPTYAASHGCVRVPYWAARWIFGLAKIGTRVIVYH